MEKIINSDAGGSPPCQSALPAQSSTRRADSGQVGHRKSCVLQTRRFHNFLETVLGPQRGKIFCCPACLNIAEVQAAALGASSVTQDIHFSPVSSLSVWKIPGMP